MLCCYNKPIERILFLLLQYLRALYSKLSLIVFLIINMDFLLTTNLDYEVKIRSMTERANTIDIIYYIKQCLEFL